MARTPFNENEEYRGGALTVQEKPPVRRYPCFAEQCPMPGTIFSNGTDKAGTCAWHYGVMPSDIPKVTRVLLDWQCVSSEIRAARRCLTGPMASDPAGLQREFEAAWQRVRGVAGAWETELAPGTIRTAKGVDTGHPQSYADWAKHLERFLGARVVEVLSTQRRRA